jgi:hypothetical protein
VDGGNEVKRISITLALALLSAAPLHAQELGDAWGTAGEEAKYYRIVDLEVPDELALETGSMCLLPDARLALGTRRGEILIVSGAFEPLPDVALQHFASGLDEVFGLDFRDGAFHAMQQTELSRISDTDGDGRADRFENLSDVWGFANYHEFGWGSPITDDGSVWVVLGLSESYYYNADFRGWAFKITPDGTSIPIASGIRSAGCVAPNEHGVMFYAESQGPWNGSCSLKHLKPGGFMGHPTSFPGYDLPLGASLGRKPLEPQSESRIQIESERIPELVPPAVVFPYRKMGQSITAFRPDRSAGRFGPFTGQLFVGDFSLSVVMRATTELVDGVWQGACYPFREGFGTGILALELSPTGHLVTGGTNRGWPVRGNRQYTLQRLEWTGKMPFEIERVSIRPDGFLLDFTKPVDPASAALLANYRIETFTHIYQEYYGSPEVDQTTPRIVSAVPTDDGLSVHLVVDGLVLGHVHAFDLTGLASQDGEELLHTQAYYTVNRIPKP